MARRGGRGRRRRGRKGKEEMHPRDIRGLSPPRGRHRGRRRRRRGERRRSSRGLGRGALRAAPPTNSPTYAGPFHCPPGTVGYVATKGCLGYVQCNGRGQALGEVLLCPTETRYDVQTQVSGMCLVAGGEGILAFSYCPAQIGVVCLVGFPSCSVAVNWHPQMWRCAPSGLRGKHGRSQSRAVYLNANESPKAEPFAVNSVDLSPPPPYQFFLLGWHLVRTTQNSSASILVVVASAMSEKGTSARPKLGTSRGVV